MSNFSNEQLRQFAELGGWSHVVISRRDQYSEIGYSGFRPGQAVSDGQLHAVPDFTKDTNLAACFEVLERFCEQRKLTWVVAKNQDGSVRCVLYAWPGQPFRRKRAASAVGPTKQEAIINAVLAAGGMHAG